MFGLGHHQSERLEQKGSFLCPRCHRTAEYGIYGVYSHFHAHVFIIPVWSEHRVGEKLRCHACRAILPISVLAGHAPTVPVAHSDEAGKSGVFQNLANVVQLTDAAAQEIRRRLVAGEFAADTVARLQATDGSGSGYQVTFDYAVADGSDWIGESHGIGILVNRRETSSLLGRTIDFRRGIFCDGRSETS